MSLPHAYTLVSSPPSPEDFLAIRLAAGMVHRSLDAIRRGLPKSIYAVSVHHSGVPVGMGRIVGDGAVVFYIADVAVLPAHQKRGLGKHIMAALVSWLQQNAPLNSAICLHADGDAQHLYAKFGFTPTSDDNSIGMELKLAEAQFPAL